MKERGRVTYVPPSVFAELQNIMTEDKVGKKAPAFKRMVEYSQIGRETAKLKRFFIGGK